jgi:hypothetical protein
MPLRGYFLRAKIFGYVLVLIVLGIVGYLTFHFFTD